MICAQLARIMIRRQKFEAARAIMAKIYSHATPEQVDLKVRIRIADSRGGIEGLTG